MSRYATAHQHPAGPGDGRPTALQIIHDQGLPDHRVLVRDRSRNCPCHCCNWGQIFLATRSLDRGQAACGHFLEPGRVELLQLDTSSLASVRAAAATFLERSPTLNVLICNAGVMQVPTREESVDGFEIQLATNYLGHFTLFWLLRDAMLRAASPSFHSGLVNVSSSGHHASEHQIDDLNLSKSGAYHPEQAYGQSKLAQISMANYVERHFGARGLHGLSLMPGGIFTKLQHHISPEIKARWASNPAVMAIIKNVEQGAATTVFAAVSKEWEGRGGKYLEDCAEAPLLVTPGVFGVRPYAYDELKETRLWEATLQALGIPGGGNSEGQVN